MIEPDDWQKQQVEVSKLPKILPRSDKPGKSSPNKNSALVACKDCGGTVSRNAAACPHCGSKAFDTVHAMSEFGKNAQSIGLAMLALGLLILLPIILALVM